MPEKDQSSSAANFSDTLPPLTEMLMPPERVIELIGLLQKEGINPILDGGWAVDAIAQDQTRVHQDVDFLVDIESGNSLRHLLEEHGLVSHPEETEMPHRLVMIQPGEKTMIDFHLVTFHEDGSATFKITNYKAGTPSYEYTYTKEGLSGIGSINDQPVRCITLDEQIRCRTTRNYSFDDPDRMRPGDINADRHDLDIIRGLAATALGDSYAEFE